MFVNIKEMGVITYPFCDYLEEIINLIQEFNFAIISQKDITLLIRLKIIFILYTYIKLKRC